MEYVRYHARRHEIPSNEPPSTETVVADGLGRTLGYAMGKGSDSHHQQSKGKGVDKSSGRINKNNVDDGTDYTMSDDVESTRGEFMWVFTPVFWLY